MNKDSKVFSLKTVKGVRNKKQVAEFASDIYIGFREGGAAELEECAELMWANKKVFRPEPQGIQEIRNFLSNYQEIQEFSENKVIRDHLEAGELERRGQKFARAFWSKSTVLPYCLFKGKKTQTGHHERMFTWWLGAMGFLEYHEEVKPWVPLSFILVYEEELNTDDILVMSRNVMKDDDRSHSYTNPQIRKTQKQGSAWANINSYVFDNVYNSKGSPVFVSTGFELEKNEYHNNLCKILTTMVKKDSRTSCMDFYLSEKSNPTARFWWGFCEAFVPQKNKQDVALAYLVPVLKGDSDLPEEAVSVLEDLEKLLAGSAKDFNFEWVGKEKIKYRAMGVKFAQSILSKVS